MLTMARLSVLSAHVIAVGSRDLANFKDTKVTLHKGNGTFMQPIDTVSYLSQVILTLI